MAVRVLGKVARLFADREGAVIQLDNDPSIGPKSNQWRLKLDHSNYNALYSLVLAAAANRWPISIRIEGSAEIDPAREAAIRHLRVVWDVGGPDDDD